MKKNWETPQLISIYRAHPEEAVLVSCKSNFPRFGPMSMICSQQFEGCQGIFNS